MSTNATSLGNWIKHAAYDYQEWIDGTKQSIANGAKHLAYDYQETMDEFSGSVVGVHPQKVDNYDRLAGAGALAAAIITAPAWMPLSLFGCGSNSTTSSPHMTDVVDATAEGEVSYNEPVAQDTRQIRYFDVPQPDTQLPDVLHQDTLLSETPQPDVTLPDMLADAPGQEFIPCGTNDCNAQTEVCCIDVPSGKEPVCIGAQEICEGVVVACNGPEDCTDAVCCAEATFEIGIIGGKKELSGNTECTPSCNFSFDFNPLAGQGKVTARACHDSEDCITTEPVCCNTPGIGTGMCLTESAATLAEEYTYGLMDCK